MRSSDCLILGFYDYPFDDYVEMLKTMGTESGAYQDVSLAFAELDGKPMRALDVLTRYHYEGRPTPERPFHNSDFLWPVVVYLTSYLRRRGFEVDYVNLPHFEMEKVRRLSKSFRAVAITTTLYVSPHPILALVEQIRRYDSEIKIVVGGPYIFNQARMLDKSELCTLFEYLGADFYILCREGEETLGALLSALRTNSKFNSVANIAFRDASGSFVFTPEGQESNALQENIIDYAPFVQEPTSELLSIRTAKSCPFACAFCGFPERAGDYQFLNVDAVREQLDAIANTNAITTLTFLDDTFNVPKGRFKEILRMMIRNGYNFKWNCFYRADQGDDEAIDLMAQAGCEGVFLGVESGSDAMLALMKKSARRKHYAQAIPRLNAAGITTYSSIIIGFPGETDESVRETIDFLEESRSDYYRAQLWYADPLTPIWKMRENYNIKGAGFNWSHSTMSAREACEWIDRIFLEVTNSEWLPQFGFEPWSIYYLSRKGMAPRQIKTFLGCFNAAIKYRLVAKARDIPQALEEKLRLSCQYDRPEGLAVEVPHRWKGEVYRAAMASIAYELSDSTCASSYITEARFSAPHGGAARSGIVTCECLLAAYALVIAEEDPGAPILALVRDGPIPMRFRSSVNDCYDVWVAEAVGKIRALQQFEHLAMEICKSRLWRKEYGLTSLAFRYAFAWRSSGSRDPTSDLQSELLQDLIEVCEAGSFEGKLNVTVRATTRPDHQSRANDHFKRMISLLASGQHVSA